MCNQFGMIRFGLRIRLPECMNHKFEHDLNSLCVPITFYQFREKCNERNLKCHYTFVSSSHKHIIEVCTILKELLHLSEYNRGNRPKLLKIHFHNSIWFISTTFKVSEVIKNWDIRIHNLIYLMKSIFINKRERDIKSREYFFLLSWGSNIFMSRYYCHQAS